jgi:aspartyl-tRNA(Asn)/glutamyl-tRNA(Gln) amidotransferase subunit A
MPILARTATAQPRADLHSVRDAIRAGQTTAQAEMERSLQIAASPTCEHAFMRTDADAAMAAARAVDALSTKPMLCGLAVGVKDLFDIAGQQTLAGSKALDHLPPAQRDAVAVARMRASGGAVIGRTAMNAFAFSGMGINPQFGTPRNATDAAVHRLPGGSSSGAGVAVATGAAFVGLGSDTGGSVRIPAALNGVVGFKPTTGIVPTTGAVPLSTTLDTVGVLTRSVRDAALAYECLSLKRLQLAGAGLAGVRIGVPRTLMLDGLDPAVAQAFDRSLRLMSDAGARVQTIDLPLLSEPPGLQAKAGFSSIEGLAWHKRHGSWARQADIDPRVVVRMGVAEGALAVDYVQLIEARRDWVARCQLAMAGFDAMASPTVPITARPVAEADASLEAFLAINALHLRNTSVINFLGGCAISLPMQEPGALGAGLMLWALPHADEALLSLSAQVEQLLCY